MMTCFYLRHAYTVAKDFAVPLTAICWAVLAWVRDNYRVITITQEDIGMFSVLNRVSELVGDASALPVILPAL
ncbi:MAG: hypothetical protein ABSG25_10090 [Bryobacteraceae bacterium]